jgi:enterochelin esterase-like enzyme
MSKAARPSRTQLWLEGLDDWSWPGGARGAIAGHGGGALELSLPSWVAALPPRLEPALAGTDLPGRGRARPQRLRTWRVGAVALLSALALAWALAAAGGATALERLLSAGASAPASRALQPATAGPPPDLPPARPPLLHLSSDAAGSSIDLASFASSSLRGEGWFFVYLPPGYAASTRRYPVLYLLHGRDGHAAAFLEVGIQASLDRLIEKKAIPPMIAVMIQDLPGLNNWRDLSARHSATYVVEVQELIDRMLRTVPARAARAIAGSSMGGFGAMNVALANPLRFAVVESWLGYFNNLQGPLRADAPVISRLGLQAFVYGAAADPVAAPAQDPAFAAELRAAGAQAQGAIYPGGHSLQKVAEHMSEGLLFAGRSLREAQRRAAAQAERRADAQRSGVRSAPRSTVSRGRPARSTPLW